MMNAARRRVAAACVATSVAVMCVATAVSARGRTRPPSQIELTELIVRKVIACHKPVLAAEARATGGVGSFYQNRMRLRDAALARCGFPKDVTWRDAYSTVRIAADDLGYEGELSELRASNRKVALPFRARLAGLE